jgi:hypothetical protein
MSKNINQVYMTNPITSNVSTDLMYFGQSPYGAGDDAAMTYANFAAQFGTPYTPAALTSANDTNVTLTLGGTPNTALLHAASITAGWSGELSLARGGTNANLTASNGGIFYSTASSGAILAGTATANQVLVSGANAAPSWSTATFPTAAGATGTVLRSNGTGWVASTATFADTYVTNAILYSNGANTVTGLAPSASAVLITTNASDIEWTSALTNGQLIIGSTGATPAVATLTAGTGVAITNGAGSITIAATGASLWVDQTTPSVVMAVNTGYTSDAGASLVTFTLPTTAAIGDSLEINGKGSGGWTIAQASGQQIHFGNVVTTSGTGGSLSSSNQYDCIRLRCITANTTFIAVSSIGNITYV